MCESEGERQVSVELQFDDASQRFESQSYKFQVGLP